MGPEGGLISHASERASEPSANEASANVMRSIARYVASAVVAVLPLRI